ncbi:Riboflavin kinase, partial [Lachnellula suecica]
LGIPTANIPVTGVPWIDTAESGVYFGLASLLPSSTQAHPDLPPSAWTTFPMVMSIGYNPFYKNKVRSAEVHVMHSFAQDFYGAWMRISIMGFIRPELDYVDKESLIRDIRMDIEVAGNSLKRDNWGAGGDGKWLGGEGFVRGEKK